MLYCPNCHYVVFDEDEVKNLFSYLDAFAETSEGIMMKEDSMLDDLHDILHAWEEGEAD